MKKQQKNPAALAAKNEAEKPYVTLAGEGRAEYEDRRSVFYAFARRTASEEEAEAFIRETRAAYSDATHVCYAYMIGSNITRFSDDGEPSGTAGLPILDVIKRGGFTDAAIAVVRYFGGTLLGTGGLVKAYGASARDAAADAGIAVFVRHRKLRLRASYSDYGKLKNELERSGARIFSESFAAEVEAEVGIIEGQAEALAERMIELTAARARVETGETYLDKG